MKSGISRRQFGTTVGAVAAVGPSLFAQAPAVRTSRKPVVVSAANGNRYKNGGSVTGVEKAFQLIVKGDDVLDALVAGVNLCELDPQDTSVGYGGLPNGDGVVQLDSCCMHGPLKRAGGVAALEGVRTPSLVARAVAHETDHHLLVGKGAQDFARSMGFTIEDDLNTETSRARWLEWKRRIDPEHYLDPQKRDRTPQAAVDGDRQWSATLSMVRDGLIDAEHVFGTINMNGINAKGDICGVTTTSGLAFKIPGRVGDSPILGAGLYVDNAAGAAGSTGRGEANLFNLCSFLIVENLRRGMHPKDAGMDALRRVQAGTVEKRLLNSQGRPNFGLNFYVLDAKSQYAGVSMYASQYAVCTENGPQTLKTEALLDGNPNP